jgi:hypothetical protein
MPPPPQPGPTQPYRIIPRPQPNGMPAGLPQMQNFYPGAQPQPETPNGYQQLPQPKLLPPAHQSGGNTQPAPALVNAAADGSNPAATVSRIVPSAKGTIPSAAPLPGSVGDSAHVPVTPPAPPAPAPILLPQDLQLQAPPMNAPWLIPTQTNYYDKK